MATAEEVVPSSPIGASAADRESEPDLAAPLNSAEGTEPAADPGDSISRWRSQAVWRVVGLSLTGLVLLGIGLRWSDRLRRLFGSLGFNRSAIERFDPLPTVRRSIPDGIDSAGPNRTGSNSGDLTLGATLRSGHYDTQHVGRRL